MKILTLDNLTSQQITDITELSKACRNYDAYFEEFSANGELCFFLCYKGQELVSFLSYLAIPTTNTDSMEAEITAMTHPSYRQQGLFSELFLCAQAQLTQLDITNIYCSIPKKYQGSSMCKGLSHLEYLQKLDINQFDQDSCEQNKGSSEQNKNSSEQNIGSSLKFKYIGNPESPIPTTYQLYKKHFIFGSKLIGNCNLSEESKFTNIWGMEIKKPYRNQGYGLQLMNYMIHNYFKLTTQPLILNVSSTNINACKLYERCGFKIVEQIEYYKLN